MRSLAHAYPLISERKRKWESPSAGESMICPQEKALIEACLDSAVPSPITHHLGLQVHFAEFLTQEDAVQHLT